MNVYAKFRWIFVIVACSTLVYFFISTYICSKVTFCIGEHRQGVQNATKTGLSYENEESDDRSCRSKSKPFWLPGYGDEYNTAWPWDPQVTWKCPDYYFNESIQHRRKATLECTSGSPSLVYAMTNSSRDIQIVEPGNTCLLSYIQNCCQDIGMPVPNVVHYVWYADATLDFYTMTSLISVLRFMRPCLILFHGAYVPKGAYWNFFIGVYPNVILVKETLIRSVFGHTLKYKEHGSDLMRIKALQTYGGLYLDWDQVLITPIEHLRRYTVTMSLETETKLGNQFIMAERNATFLTYWYMGYKAYNGEWIYNSIKYPFILSKKYPELIHVENYTCIIQNIAIQHVGASLWETNFDWSNNYGLHIYMRGSRNHHVTDMVKIRKQNHTVGAVCRRILLGKKEVCE